MGVTIHFEGRLKSLGQATEMVRIAKDHASRWGREARAVDDSSGGIFDHVAGRHGQEHGHARGVIMSPHAMSEPVMLLYDPAGVVMFSTKTQFAPPSAHMAIVALLEDLQPLFATMEVNDEGVYWGTHDAAELHRRLEFLDHAIDHVADMLSHGRPKPRKPQGPALN